jgi:hypothetical protein
MSRNDELALHALGAGAIVAAYSFVFASIRYAAVVDQYRHEHNLTPVLEQGLIWNYYRDADVSFSDLGLTTVLSNIILPTIIFFVAFIVVARVVDLFCAVAEKFFQFAVQTDEKLRPRDHEFLFARVAFWPFFLIYGVLLVCGSLIVLLFKSIWR